MFWLPVQGIIGRYNNNNNNNKFYFSDMSIQLPADTTAYKSLLLLQKKKHSHDVRFKNII